MVVTELASRLQEAAIANYHLTGIGKMAAPALSPEWRLESRLQTEITKIELRDDVIILAKPQTMMNASGEAVSKIMQLYKIAPADVWVIFDDLDMPFGKLRIRAEGQSGSGHQGVTSIIARIGPRFRRVKVGISLNDRAQEPSEIYVLRPFNADETPQLTRLIQAAAQAIQDQLTLPAPSDNTVNLIP
jgi:PTH1 family peptidyl-tRNA hydrolase